MKRTIYFNPATAAILDFANEPNLSARVAQVAESWAMACDAGQIPRDEPDALASALVRYRAILDEAAPALAESEWALLCDMLNGSMLTADRTDTDPARHIIAILKDSWESGLGEKWDVDIVYLTSRLADMSYPAHCAIVETVARFWRQAGRSIGPIGEQIRAAGARVASGEEIAA